MLNYILLSISGLPPGPPPRLPPTMFRRSPLRPGAPPPMRLPPGPPPCRLPGMPPGPPPCMPRMMRPPPPQRMPPPNAAGNHVKRPLLFGI